MFKKTFTLTLVVAFLLTNAVFLYAGESNFWSDRKKNITSNEIKKSAQFASLTGPLNSIPKTPVEFQKQFPQIEKNLGLSTEKPNWNPIRPGVRRGGRPLADGIPLPKTFRKFLESISLQKGTIKDVFISPKNLGNPDQAPLLFLIQDVHLNYEAQKNISDIIQSLGNVAEGQGPRKLLVGVEGAFGPFRFEKFHLFPDKKQKEEVADYFLKKGKIAAPSFTGITAENSPLVFYGIDDPIHYKSNVQAYLTATNLKEGISKKLSKLERELADIKSKTLNPDLKTFDALSLSFHKKSLDLAPYLKTLTRLEEKIKTGTEQDATPPRELALEQFLKAYEIEKGLDWPRVEQERTRVVEKLVPKLSSGQIKDLMIVGLAHQMGKLSYAAYYTFLQTLLEKNGVDLSETPAFSKYVEYVLLAETINAEDVLKALKRLENKVVNSLSKTEAEKVLMRQTRQLFLTEKLLDFALIPEEWEEYREGVKSPLSPISREIGDRGDLTPSLSSFEAFYEEADARSQKMVENLTNVIASPERSEGRGNLMINKIASSHQDFGTSQHYENLSNGTSLRNTPRNDNSIPSVGALIIGGFHTPQLTRILKSQGYSYAVIQPKVTKIETGSGSEYLSIFTQEKTPLDQIFSGRKLFLAPYQTAAGTLLGAKVAAEATGVLVHRGINNGTVDQGLLKKLEGQTSGAGADLAVTVPLPDDSQNQVKVGPKGDEIVFEAPGHPPLMAREISTEQRPRKPLGFYTHPHSVWSAMDRELEIRRGETFDRETITYFAGQLRASAPLLREDPLPEESSLEPMNQQVLRWMRLDMSQDKDLETFLVSAITTLGFADPAGFLLEQFLDLRGEEAFDRFINNLDARLSARQGRIEPEDVEPEQTIGKEPTTLDEKIQHSNRTERVASLFARGFSSPLTVGLLHFFKTTKHHSPESRGLLLRILADSDLSANKRGYPLIDFSNILILPNLRDAIKISERTLVLPRTRALAASILNFLNRTFGITVTDFRVTLLSIFLAPLREIFATFLPMFVSWHDNQSEDEKEVRYIGQWLILVAFVLTFFLTFSPTTVWTGSNLWALGYAISVKLSVHFGFDIVMEFILAPPKSSPIIEKPFVPSPTEKIALAPKKLIPLTINFKELRNADATPPIILGEDTLVSIGEPDHPPLIILRKAPAFLGTNAVSINPPQQGHLAESMRLDETALTLKPGDKFFVGRHPHNDYVTSGQVLTISRFHFVIEVDGKGRVVVRDLLSRNGVNVLIQNPDPNQQIEIGRIHLGDTGQAEEARPEILPDDYSQEESVLKSETFEPGKLFSLDGARAELDRLNDEIFPAGHPKERYFSFLLAFIEVLIDKIESPENPFYDSWLAKMTVLKHLDDADALITQATASREESMDALPKRPLPPEMALGPNIEYLGSREGAFRNYLFRMKGLKNFILVITTVIGPRGNEILLTFHLEQLVDKRFFNRVKLTGEGTTNSAIRLINSTRVFLQFAEGTFNLKTTVSGNEQSFTIDFDNLENGLKVRKNGPRGGGLILGETRAKAIAWLTSRGWDPKIIEQRKFVTEFLIGLYASWAEKWRILRPLQFFLAHEERTVGQALGIIMIWFAMLAVPFLGTLGYLYFASNPTILGFLILALVSIPGMLAAQIAVHALYNTGAAAGLWKMLSLVIPSVPPGFGASSRAARGHPERNEDAWLAMSLPNGVQIAAVADGIGGGDMGELASWFIVNRIERCLQFMPGNITDSEIIGLLSITMQMIAADLTRDPELGQADAGAVVTAAVILPDGNAYIINAGDTRAYLSLPDGSLSFLTIDNHKGNLEGFPYVMREGLLKRELKATKQEKLANATASEDLGDSSQSEFEIRNRVANMIRTSTPYKPVITVVRVPPGSRIILVSDGVHDPLTHKEITALVNKVPDPKELATRLVDAAFQRLEDVEHFRSKGERGDDVTAVVIRVGENFNPGTPMVAKSELPAPRPQVARRLSRVFTALQTQPPTTATGPDLAQIRSSFGPVFDNSEAIKFAVQILRSQPNKLMRVCFYPATEGETLQYEESNSARVATLLADEAAEARIIPEGKTASLLGEGTAETRENGQIIVFFFKNRTPPTTIPGKTEPKTPGQTPTGQPNSQFSGPWIADFDVALTQARIASDNGQTQIGVFDLPVENPEHTGVISFYDLAHLEEGLKSGTIVMIDDGATEPHFVKAADAPYPNNILGEADAVQLAWSQSESDPNRMVQIFDHFWTATSGRIPTKRPMEFIKVNEGLKTKTILAVRMGSTVNFVRNVPIPRRAILPYVAQRNARIIMSREFQDWKKQWGAEPVDRKYIFMVAINHLGLIVAFGAQELSPNVSEKLAQGQAWEFIFEEDPREEGSLRINSPFPDNLSPLIQEAVNQTILEVRKLAAERSGGSLTLSQTAARAASWLTGHGFKITELKIRLLAGLLELFQVFTPGFAGRHFENGFIPSDLFNRIFVHGGTWAIRLTTALLTLITLYFLGAHFGPAIFQAASSLTRIGVLNGLLLSAGLFSISLGLGISAGVALHLFVTLGAWIGGYRIFSESEIKILQAVQVATHPENFAGKNLTRELNLPPVVRLGIGQLTQTEKLEPARIILRVMDPAKSIEDELKNMAHVKRPQDRLVIVAPPGQMPTVPRAAELARAGIQLLANDARLDLSPGHLKSITDPNISACRVLIDENWIRNQKALEEAPQLWAALRTLEAYNEKDLRVQIMITIGEEISRLIAIPFSLSQVSRFELLREAVIAIQA